MIMLSLRVDNGEIQILGTQPTQIAETLNRIAHMLDDEVFRGPLRYQGKVIKTLILTQVETNVTTPES